MKAAICLLMLITVASLVLADISGECDMAGFYLELGCTPLPKVDSSSACPDAFSCPDLHPDPTMCYYRGVPYSDKSNLPQVVINNPCSQACRCSVSGEVQFECAAVDCVETFSPDIEQCVATYELESCCSVGKVCGKDATEKLSSCEVDGKTYKEGQSFEPLNTRKTCICTPQWNGSAENPAYCRDINCGIEIHYQASILKNCAPVFIGNAKSCPISFECATTKSKIVQGLNVRSVSSKCVFGNMTLSVGDEVTADEENVKCSCDVPPFVSCTRQY